MCETFSFCLRLRVLHLISRNEKTLIGYSYLTGDVMAFLADDIPVACGTQQSATCWSDVVLFLFFFWLPCLLSCWQLIPSNSKHYWSSFESRSFKKVNSIIVVIDESCIISHHLYYSWCVGDYNTWRYTSSIAALSTTLSAVPRYLFTILTQLKPFLWTLSLTKFYCFLNIWWSLEIRTTNQLIGFSRMQIVLVGVDLFSVIILVLSVESRVCQSFKR